MTVTVRQVLDYLMEPVGRLESTVDRLSFGRLESEVKGIATVFIATHEVIEQAIALGVNLIITHEGTFYSHLDRTDGLEQDPVYQGKRQLIEASGIAIFRFHDYFHRYRPDGIMAGLLEALGWTSFVQDHQPAASILAIPPMSVRQVAEHMKQALHIPFVRMAGEEELLCTRIGVLAGYRGGGSTALPLFEKEGLDLVIAGEGPEWETPEYVKDAVHQGKRKAFILLGHAESEEPGMEHLAGLLRTQFESVPVHFLPARRSFQVL
ncbi:Nif3-like dinuclear metal center hexameric protein [Paenibacillus rigui]|uniref:GTP cyclohydrolase 1 type 2 homolog n=1 Tax=Paenibacillus rigui TaxID=554312 RepID=A0A229USB3_9BACL|nr:Nif3-like dinuclear metal center hexameric protein [Paenibacillus rigui]OXM86292.1 transcriptional regulator [Paenibacillus rigui]